MGPQTHCVCHEILLASYPGRCGGGKDVFPPPQRPGYEARNTACVYIVVTFSSNLVLMPLEGMNRSLKFENCNCACANLQVLPIIPA